MRQDIEYLLLVLSLRHDLSRDTELSNILSVIDDENHTLNFVSEVFEVDDLCLAKIKVLQEKLKLIPWQSERVILFDDIRQKRGVFKNISEIANEILTCLKIEYVDPEYYLDNIYRDEG